MDVMCLGLGCMLCSDGQLNPVTAQNPPGAHGPKISTIQSIDLSSKPPAPERSRDCQVSAQATTSPHALQKMQTTPRIAFISGHIDLPEEQFLLHYQTPLTTAIHNNDQFILSNAQGADSLALQFLLHHGVHPSRITIYIHIPPARRAKRANATMRSVDEARTGDATLEAYREKGLQVRVVNGWHTERDAAMTAASDYDILWVRPEEETRALYGEKYRAGRVSGTQKNRERRGNGVGAGRS